MSRKFVQFFQKGFFYIAILVLHDDSWQKSSPHHLCSRQPLVAKRLQRKASATWILWHEEQVQSGGGRVVE